MPIVPNVRTSAVGYGSVTAPTRPHAVPVEMGCVNGVVPVSMTFTPPGQSVPFTVTLVATMLMLMAPHASFVMAIVPVTVKPDAEIVVIFTLLSNPHAVSVPVSDSVALPLPADCVPASVPWYAPWPPRVQAN